MLKRIANNPPIKNKISNDFRNTIDTFMLPHIGHGVPIQSLKISSQSLHLNLNFILNLLIYIF